MTILSDKSERIWGGYMGSSAPKRGLNRLLTEAVQRDNGMLPTRCSKLRRVFALSFSAFGMIEVLKGRERE